MLRKNKGWNPILGLYAGGMRGKKSCWNRQRARSMAKFQGKQPSTFFAYLTDATSGIIEVKKRW